MTNADAFSQGSAAASTSTTYTGINTSQAANSLQTYGTTSPEASYFGGGIGDTVTPGSSKKAGCAASTPSDPAAAQECNAINYLQALPSHTPSLGLTRADPLLVSGKTVTNDPEALAANLGKTYAGCTATTVLDPGTTTYEVCNDYLAIGQNVCKINRLITVAVDRTYQCIKQDMTIQTQTCNRSITASIGSAIDFYMPDQCTTIMGTGCNPFDASPTDAARFNAAMGAGQNKLFVNGSYLMTLSTPMYPRGNYPGQTLNIVEDLCDLTRLRLPGVNCRFAGRGGYFCDGGPLYQYGRGTQFSMCGASSCTAVSKQLEANGAWGYICMGSTTSTTCPTGYSSRVDGSGIRYCHEDSYATYSADANCAYLGASAISVPGTKSATQYKWACKIVNDGCTALQAKSL